MFRLTGILLLLTMCSLPQSAGITSYPVNPARDSHALYVSSSGITRIDLQSGQPVWKRLEAIQTFEPVLTERYLLAGTSQGLYALETDDGRVLWRLKLTGPVFSPALWGNVAFASDHQGSLIALKANTGELIWQRIFKGWLYTPVIEDSVLIVGGQEHRVYGLNTETGHTLWQIKIPHELVYRPVPVGNGSVILTTFAGDILNINVKRGEIIWHRSLPAPAHSPVIINQQTLIPTLDGSLLNLDSRDGQLKWAFQLAGRPRVSLRMLDNTIAVADGQGRVVGLDLNNGKRFWEFRYQGEMIGRPVVHENDILIIRKTFSGMRSESYRVKKN